MVAIFIIILSCVLLLQIPKVQARVTSHFLEKLNVNIDGKVQFSAIHLMPKLGLVIDDLVILDESPYTDSAFTEPVDTLFRARCVSASFSVRGLLSEHGSHIGRVYIQDGLVNMAIEPGVYKTNLTRIFKLTPKDSVTRVQGEIFDIQKIKAENLRYRMYKCDLPASEDTTSIDWFRLDLVADVTAHSMKFADGVMRVVVDEVSLSEKCGYTLDHLSGRVRVGDGKAEITNIKFKDQWSDLNLPLYRMSYDNSRAFQYFLTDIKLDGEIRNSTLDLRTLAAFVSSLPHAPVTLAIKKATVEGPVDDLHVRNTEFKELGSGVYSKLECGIGGIVSGNIYLDTSISSLDFTTAGIDCLLKEFNPKQGIVAGKYARGESLHFSGKAKGKLNNLKVAGKLTSRLGGAETDLSVKHLTDSSPLEVSGNFGTEDLDIGRIMGIEQLRQCTLNTTFSATLGQTISARIEALDVSRLNLLGYDYTGLLAAGTLDGPYFDGRLICNDPNLNFLFQGVCDLSLNNSNARYKFVASLPYADLNALHIDKRPVSKVSLLRLNGDYTRVARGDLDGTIEATGIQLEGESGREDIGNLSIWSHSAEGNHRIRLTSSFAEAEFEGTKPITELLTDLPKLTADRELTALTGNVTGDWEGDQYRLGLEMHDSRKLMSFVLPGMYVADSTSARLNINKDGRLNATVRSSRLAFEEKYIKDARISIDNQESALNFKFTSDKLSLSDAFYLDNNTLLIYANDNSVGVGCYYDNATEEENHGELYLTADLYRDESDSLTVDAKTLTSNIYINGSRWHINPAEICYDGNSLQVSDLMVECEGQSILLDGGIARNAADTLDMSIKNLDLGIVDTFTALDLGLKGDINGRATLVSPFGEDIGISADITANDAVISGCEAGDINISAGWNDLLGRIDFSLNNDHDGIQNADISGSFTPDRNAIAAKVHLDEMQAGIFSPIVAEIFSRMEGKISGDITLGGTLDRLDINGEDCKVTDGLLEVAYTQVPYMFDGPFSIDNKGITFNDIAVQDGARGTGTISGGIKYDRLKSIRMDTRIRMNDLKCINLKKGDNEAFYGDVSGTGSLSITGPFNNLLMDVNASTSGRGELHIPLSAATKGTTSDLLTFKEIEYTGWMDPYEQMMQRIEIERKEKSSFSVKLKIGVDQQTQAYVEVDETTGTELSGNGVGNLSLDITDNLFNINGDYTLSSGNFHFSAFGLAKRDFTIQDGSSIQFNGDILDSDLNIDALYSIKTSLAKLIADDTIASNRTVDCGINISGKLNNPSLDFSIDVPDLNPTIKSQVESALNTDDKLQKQFIALLLTGNFLPDDQSSGIFNTSNAMLFSNVAEIMANQLNNILERLEIPLDLGLDYQENKSGDNIFDVAVSTQLFNNRVIMNGSIGNRRYGTTSTSDVVGDIDIEIKLDKSGQIRLTLFSHSADDYTNYLDNMQRNGVGIAYQKEFNSLKEFLHQLFTSKKNQTSVSTPEELKTIIVQ